MALACGPRRVEGGARSGARTRGGVPARPELGDDGRVPRVGERGERKRGVTGWAEGKGKRAGGGGFWPAGNEKKRKGTGPSLSPSQAQPASPPRFRPKTPGPGCPRSLKNSDRQVQTEPAARRAALAVPAILASARALRRLDGGHLRLPGTTRVPFPWKITSGASLTRLGFD